MIYLFVKSWTFQSYLDNYSKWGQLWLLMTISMAANKIRYIEYLFYFVTDREKDIDFFLSINIIKNKKKLYLENQL